MPVGAPPADKRFRRAHVRPTRQASWRSRWLKLLVGAAVTVVIGCVVYGAVGLALTAGSLTIRRIAVTGNERLSTGEVHALLSDLIGTSMFTADINASKRRLLASPWVASVEIRRLFPGALSVALEERRAVALGRIGPDLFLVDRTGTIIDEFGPNYADFDLPIVDGLGPPQGGGLLIDEPRARLASHVIASLQSRPELASRVSQIDVSDLRDVVLVLKDDPAMVRLGNDRFVERLQSYLELAATLRERVPDIDTVDLRYDERVYVRPHPERASQKPRGGKG